MKIPEWIISSFDVEVESENLDIFIEMTFDMESQGLYNY